MILLNIIQWIGLKDNKYIHIWWRIIILMDNSMEKNMKIIASNYNLVVGFNGLV